VSVRTYRWKGWLRGTYECNEERQDIYDRQCESGFEHRARLVRADVDVHPSIRRPSIAGRAVLSRDAAKVVHARDQGADDGEVEESDEEGVVAGAEVVDGGEDGPGEGYDGDDEEDEDVGGGEEVGVDVLVDEPGQHAHDGDEGDDLEEAPGEEEEAGDCHCDGVWWWWWCRGMRVSIGRGLEAIYRREPWCDGGPVLRRGEVG